MKEHTMNDGQRLAGNRPERREAARARRRSAALAVLAAAAVLGLAACGSGSGSTGVASLPAGSHGGGSPAASGSAAASGAMSNVTQLLNEWAACMRGLGDTSQTTPTVDASKVIHIIDPPDFTGSMGLGGKGGTNSCSHYMSAASGALGATTSTPHDKHTGTMLKLAKCMRAHGIADFPDPGSNGQINMPPDANTAKFAAAQKTCVAQLGLTARIHAPGSIEQTTPA